jgi:DNA-binding Lrp family transcriptional regulator
MQFNKLHRTLLQGLCLNSRTRTPELSRKIGISRYKITNLIKEVEKELGLSYTLELDYKKLGFGALHLTYLNFEKKPSLKSISDVLNKIPSIQLALATNGDFELLCFTVTKTAIEYSQVEVAMQILFERYGTMVHSSEITLMRHGFVPLSNALIGQSAIEGSYKSLLPVLNTNSRMKIREISKRINMSEDLVRYYMIKMKKERIIRRYTTIVTKPNTKFTIAYFSSYSVRENIRSRIDKERNEIIFRNDEVSYVNNFQMMFSITGSGQAFNLAAFPNRKYGLEHSINAHNAIYAPEKPEVKKAVIIKVVKGILPLRNIDVKANYDYTNWPTEFS